MYDSFIQGYDPHVQCNYLTFSISYAELFTYKYASKAKFIAVGPKHRFGSCLMVWNSPLIMAVPPFRPGPGLLVHIIFIMMKLFFSKLI